MGAMPGSLSEKRSIAANPKAAGLAPGAASRDRIAWVRASLVVVPLGREINDAKVLTGRQRPLTEVALLVVETTRSEEHTSELQSLMRISYAVFCLKKKKQIITNNQ